MKVLRFDIQSAWDYAKEKHGLMASQSDWLAALDPESLTELKSILSSSDGSLSLSRLAHSIIK